MKSKGINEVEEYLKHNDNKVLSLFKICKEINMKRRKAIYLINKSNNIKLVSPIDVGSGKVFLHIYKYVNSE